MTRGAGGRFRRTVSPLTGALCCVSLVMGLAAAAGVTPMGKGMAGFGAPAV